MSRACGTYLHADIVNGDALIALLDELETTPGAPVDCDHRLRIRSASYAGQDHTSFELPFEDVAGCQSGSGPGTSISVTAVPPHGPSRLAINLPSPGWVALCGSGQA